MRSLSLFLPMVLMGQTLTGQTTPPSKAPAAPPKTAAPAASKAAAAPGTSITPKPAATTASNPPVAARPAARSTVTTVKPSLALTTDEQKTIYAIGLSIYKSLAAFDFTPAELEVVKRAISDAQAKTPAVPLEEWGPKIQAMVVARAKATSTAYLAKCAAEPGAIKTESGLIYKELRAGDGPSPKPTDTVKVNYRGTLVNGTEFDSSYKTGHPAEFALNGVIKCWTEGVQKIKVGGKGQLVCPADLAYGEQGNPSIPGGSTLIFDIELLDIPTAK